MKKLSITLVFLFVFLGGHLAVASFLEEGPYLEIEESSDINFFMLDADEFQLSDQANLPDMMPLHGTITSPFGLRRYSRRARRVRWHKGLDIAAPVGSPIFAPADGRVEYVGRKGGYGQTLVIDHGGELATLYAHNSRIMVQAGDKIVKGQEICLVGVSGRSTGPHLHYEVRVKGKPVNPSLFF